jgi:hypothetical protein
VQSIIGGRCDKLIKRIAARYATDGDRTPQSALFQEARERNTRSQQLIEGTIRIIARSRELLSRLSGRERRADKLSTDARGAFGTRLKS